MSDLDDAIASLNKSADRANNTTDFFDSVTTGGATATVKNNNNGKTVPSIQKQVKDLYDESETEINQAVSDAEDAKYGAVEAKNETQALFNSFDSSVAISIAVSKTYVAFEATFNDSLNISKGYGTHDTITVASEVIELPTKSVDFICANSQGFTNKSGVSDAAEINKPAIGVNGLILSDTPETFASIPTMNNFPENGDAFAIELDTAFLEDGFAFDIETEEANTGISLSCISDVVTFKFSASNGDDITATHANDGEFRKYVSLFDATSIKLYVDGDLSATTTISNEVCSVDFNGIMAIGSDIDGDNNLNSQLKNLRVHFGALSDDAVKSFGAASYTGIGNSNPEWKTQLIWS